MTNYEFASNQIVKDLRPAGSPLPLPFSGSYNSPGLTGLETNQRPAPHRTRARGEKPSTRISKNLKDRSGRPYSVPAAWRMTGILLPNLPNRRHQEVPAVN